MKTHIRLLPSPRLRSARRLVCRSIAAVGALSILAGAAAMSAAATASAAEPLTTIAGSFRLSTDADAGEFTTPKMTIEVVLAPRNPAELETHLADLYRSGSPSYHQWLETGEFYSRYAPGANQIAAVVSHLAASGLTVEPSSSPFLVRASGASSTVAAAFSTTLHNYRSRNGINYFANGSAIKLPASVAAGVLGVVGLTNTVLTAIACQTRPTQQEQFAAQHPGMRDTVSHRDTGGRLPSRNFRIPLRLRRWSGLQRPDAVSDQLDL